MGDLDGSPKRSAPMSIGGNNTNNSELGLSQSCPLKPMKLFKIPTAMPSDFALPKSISEHEPLNMSGVAQPVPVSIVEDDLFESGKVDEEGPGRSFIRAEGFENISAEEFNSNVKERATFLSQSCPGPNWGDMTVLQDFPPRPKRNQEEVAAPAEADLQVQFSKLGFDEFAENLSELGRSPTIFESLKFVSVGLPEEEQDPEVENEGAEQETLDEEPDLDFAMDE